MNGTIFTVEQSQSGQVSPLTPLSKIRANRSTWGRKVLGVFVVAWMSAALQPCLMAMEMSPGEEVATSAHANHDSSHSESSYSVVPTCQHCPPSISGGDRHCETLEMSGCELLPDIKQGDRLSKLEAGDAHFVAIVSNAFRFDSRPLFVTPFSGDSVGPNYSSGPPINLKNCVFLK